ncbi:MAG: GntR family transcriptional regulator, partial [Acidimicrobiia bacterium]|nr:GntR family transcriptional regulator [Acidimicrobiia bacterium]
MTFTSLDRKTVRLADLVYEQIFRAIVKGEVAPGERLVQEAIGEQMKVSRTPVRDALLRLESEGILESSGRGGYLVRSFDRQEAMDIYGLRAAVEGYAAGIAARLADPAAIGRITAAVSAAGGSDISLDEGFEMNRRIHRSIVEAAGNTMMLDTFDSIWGRSQSFRMFARLHSPEMRYLHNEPSHQDVLE